MVIGLYYCSRDGIDLQRDPYYNLNLNHNIGTRTIAIEGQSPDEVKDHAEHGMPESSAASP